MLKLKNIIILLVFFVPVVSCAGFDSLSKGKFIAEPEFEVSSIRFKEIDLQELRLDVGLNVTNPNKIAMNFELVEYELFVDGASVLDGETQAPFSVPANNTFALEIPLNIKLSEMANGAVSLMLNRKINYELNARLYPKLLILGKKEFKVNKEGVLTF